MSSSINLNLYTITITIAYLLDLSPVKTLIPHPEQTRNLQIAQSCNFVVAVLVQEGPLQTFERILLEPTLCNREQTHQPQYSLDLRFPYHFCYECVNYFLWALRMVDQMLKCMTLLIIDLCVLLLNIVANIVVNITQWLHHWNVHFLNATSNCCQFFQVASLGLISHIFNLLYFLLKKES